MLHCIILNFQPFLNFDKCRPEAAGDVISGMALDYVGVDVRATFGDYKLNQSINQNP